MKRMVARIARMAVSPSFVALFMRAAVLGSMLLLNAVLSRNLSATEFGAFIFVMNISIFVAIVGQFGFRSYIVKEVAHLHRDRLVDQYSSLLVRCYIVAFVVSLFVSVLIFMFGWDLVSDRTGINISIIDRIVLIFAFAFASSNLFVPDFFRGALRNKFSNISGHYLYNILLLLMIIFYLYTFNIIDFSLYVRMALFAAVICSAFGVFSSFLMFGFQGTYRSNYLLLIYSAVPFLVSNIATYLMINSDLWVVAVNEGPEVVGVYGAAARLALLVGMPVQIGLTIMIGRVAHLVAANDIDALERVARRAAAAFMVFSLVLAAPLVLMGGSVMRLVYGPGFEVGGHIVSTLAIAHFATAMSGAAQAILLQAGQQRAVMVITLMFAVANYLVASWIGSGKLGLSVAIVYAVGLAAYAVCLIFLVRRKLGIWVLPYVSLQSITGKQ